MPSSHLILCRPLLLLPPIFPSIRVFSNEPALCIRWPKYWSFSNDGKGYLPGTFRFSARGCVRRPAASDPLSLPGAAVLRAALQSRVSSSPPQPRALPPSSPRRPPQSALLPGSNPRHLLIFDGKHEEAGNTAVHVPSAGSSLALSDVAFKLSFPRLLGEESD